MSGRSKGFGFVEMEDDEAARTAIANLNETEVQGRKLIVNESQPRQEGDYKKRSGGGFGGGGNRRRWPWWLRRRRKPWWLWRWWLWRRRWPFQP